LTAWLEVIDGAVAAKMAGENTKKSAEPHARHMDLPKT
jgi:hypothetical protein